jgi:pyruvate/2-oxoglutarate dehydrogenase complex dihydrolipoamide acyltransferase (E2) component
MELAQDYFVHSTEALKDQIKENRATLERLPDQIPGGRDEAFQAMFQELMDNYSNIQSCLEEAQQNVSDLDPDQIRRQEEVDATDAARREARERGVDLTKLEGTGADGRIIVTDVVEAAEAMQADEGESEDGAAGAAQQAQDAAGQVAGQAQRVAGQAADQAGQVAGQAQDAAGQAAGQAQQVAGQAQDAAGQATQQVQDTAGQAAGQVQDTVGGLTGGGQQGGGPLGGVTDQVGQVAGQAQQAAGQVTDQAGQVAQQGQQAAGGGGAEEPRATNAARRRAQELGVDLSQIRGTGAGGLITIRDVTGS